MGKSVRGRCVEKCVCVCVRVCVCVCVRACVRADVGLDMEAVPRLIENLKPPPGRFKILNHPLEILKPSMKSSLSNLVVALADVGLDVEAVPRREVPQAPQQPCAPAGRAAGGRLGPAGCRRGFERPGSSAEINLMNPMNTFASSRAGPRTGGYGLAGSRDGRQRAAPASWRAGGREGGSRGAGAQGLQVGGAMARRLGGTGMVSTAMARGGKARISATAGQPGEHVGTNRGVMTGISISGDPFD